MKKEATVTDLHELLMHVVEHMATREETATKTDLEAVREEMATKTELSAGFASIRSEISEIKQELKNLEEMVQGHAGFTKEIDHALTRIAVIERHLGLQVS